MLMYGESYHIPDRCVVFNITSMREDLPKLNLIPPEYVGRLNSRDFDIAYMNYIFGYDPAFAEFFQIINNLYMGNDVYLVMTAGQDWSENLLESILKIIQQRYGYNAVRIYTPDDYIQAQNTRMQFDPTYGLMNLDADKQRYAMMFMNMNPVPQFDEDTPPWN